MFNVAGADGHFLPMVPLARALQTAGDDVVFVVPTPYREAVTERGFRSFAVEAPRTMTGSEDIAAVNKRRGVERLRYTVEGFLDLAVINAERLVELAGDEQPDVLIRETTGWGAWLAGELLNVPVAMFDYTPMPAGLMAKVAGDLFQAARARLGLPPEDTLASLDRWLTILGAPPGWFASECFRPTTHLLQPPDDQSEGGSLPDWFASLPDRATVYVTLGTVFNQTPGVFEMVLDAIEDLDANVIVTTGRTIDPASFGQLPDHVHVEQFIPQGLLLQHCDAVIAHGGYGSLMGALRHGLPVVSIPLAAGDNHANATRLVQLGAGTAVPETERSAEKIRAAAHAVLHEPSYRAAAERIADGIAALPPFTDAVQLIQRLASERRPVLRSETTHRKGPQPSQS